MKCYKCNSNNTIKNGKSTLGKQKYKCKDCLVTITEDGKYQRVSPEVLEQAEKLYSEGLGFRAIGRVLGYSFFTILTQLKKNSKNTKHIMTNK